MPAVITYAWILGARSTTGAYAFGAVTGGLLGAGCLLLVFWADRGNEAGLDNALKVPLVIHNGLQWGIAGLFGGFAIDKRAGVFWRMSPAQPSRTA